MVLLLHEIARNVGEYQLCIVEIHVYLINGMYNYNLFIIILYYRLAEGMDERNVYYITSVLACRLFNNGKEK